MQAWEARDANSAEYISRRRSGTSCRACSMYRLSVRKIPSVEVRISWPLEPVNPVRYRTLGGRVTRKAPAWSSSSREASRRRRAAWSTSADDTCPLVEEAGVQGGSTRRGVQGGSTPRSEAERMKCCSPPGPPLHEGPAEGRSFMRKKAAPIFGAASDPRLPPTCSLTHTG